ncbi:MAG TPA: thermonuclease family protein [bacterium]|nr:thermonuclease family protein [bacterium]
MFKVTNVWDGDSFEVTPKWSSNGNSGNGVRLADYNAPEKGQPGYEGSKRKLEGMILGKLVELKKPRATDKFGRLVCDVFVDGKQILMAA